jgi:hypothetical protein
VTVTGPVTPPTISPRIDCEQYRPLASSDTIGPRNGLSGSDEQISWRMGQVGSSRPTIRASCGDHAPHALMTPRVPTTGPREVVRTIAAGRLGLDRLDLGVGEQMDAAGARLRA